MAFETSGEAGVEGVQRHLNRVEFESRVQHCEVNHRVLMSSEADKTHLAVFLCFCQGLGRAVGADEQFGIVLECHSVNLPEIEMIRLQASQRFFQHL
jgi:hypothetical protein